MTLDSQPGEFRFSGKFLGYVFKDGYKIKRLTIATPEGEFSIKMTKLARASLKQTLLPGEQIQVGGWKKFDRKTNTLKFKAYWIQPISIPAPLPCQAVAKVNATKISDPKPQKPGKESILMCQKSSCMKRGGKAVCSAIEKAISDRGLEDQVKIKGTGCMKACGKVPVVFMPGKTRYTKLNPKDVASLVDEHFALVSKPATEPTLPAEPATILEAAPVLAVV
ncbi:(2Fe-2S) ferredoxin domain-containing protein [Cyanobacteria bacterium FACHB-63]|nr:(2Fe-2S) ferredoxin domain-containing protein [Cyanobacteria bacterium FACHB-63]